MARKDETDLSHALGAFMPDDDELALSEAENAGLLREWAAQGPQGPIDDSDDLPNDE
jgi:hypothetical protein